MDILMIVLLLLVCLLISNIISHYTPFVPAALVQIALGILVALVFTDISFEIETEWFLLLFVAPILYNDGRNFPREELWKMKAPILGNAILLVVFTTIGGGYFIHWMIPDVPLAAAFALAAILSPTDPVAVNGIARRIRIPEKALNLVRGESLINDASGLVAFNYAVAAVVTGYFSLQEALLDFSYKFFAGGILGIVLGLLISWIRFRLRRQGIHDVTFHSLLQLLTPFLIYMVTEELFHASGVIAVVAGGIVHSLIRERVETLIAEEQILTENIWTIMLFALNGVVFLLLGLNIPLSMSGTLEHPERSYMTIILYVLALSVVILGIRFLWAYLFSHYEYRFGKDPDTEKPNFKMTFIVSLTGVRGTVTMAGVLSMPYLLANGDAFPNRSLLLFLAAGVILMTLIAATVLLPVLSRGKATEGQAAKKLDTTEARRRILLLSIQNIRDRMTEENADAAYELIREYETMLDQVRPEDESIEQVSDRYQRKLKELRMFALREEERFIREVRERNEIDDAVFDAFRQAFIQREEALSRTVRFKNLFLRGELLLAWRRFRLKHSKEEETKLAFLQKRKDLQIRALQAALEQLQTLHRDQGRNVLIEAVIADYERMISRLENPSRPANEAHEQLKEELRIKVIDKGRSEIFRMYETGDISQEQARILRRFVNYVESITLYERGEE